MAELKAVSATEKKEAEKLLAWAENARKEAEKLLEAWAENARSVAEPQQHVYTTPAEPGIGFEVSRIHPQDVAAGYPGVVADVGFVIWQPHSTPLTD